MKALRRLFTSIRCKWVLTPDQADHLATLKFSCC